MNKCVVSGCNVFVRPITPAEYDNILGFNLSRSTAQKILKKTMEGYCPFHAAKSLSDEGIEIEGFILEALKNWNPYGENYTDSEKYALCCECSAHLNRGISQREKEVRDSKADNELLRLGIPQKRRNTIIWLQHALNGMGTCFSCCLEKHTDYELDDSLELITNDLDDLAAVEMKSINSR